MSLRVTAEDGVTVLELDRQDVLNAFDESLGAELVQAVETAAGAPEVRCIVITGAGRAFSAGEDLAALQVGYSKGKPPDLGEILERRYNPLVRAVRAAPKPVVAAVNGVAAGAGASLALACDFRIASEHAKLVFAFSKVGLVPDSGALWFLARLVGQARAYELAVAGAPLSAHEALELGLFNEVIPTDAFQASWSRFARDLAEGPTVALGLTKHLLEAATSRSLHEQLDEEAIAQRSAGATADHLEGVRAFLDKRAPRFHGR